MIDESAAPPDSLPSNWDLFVSYCSEDRDLATQLADRLSNRGLRVWYDKFQQSTDLTTNSIRTAIQYSKACVILLSAKATPGPWVEHEWLEVQRNLWARPEFVAIAVRWGDAVVPPFLRKYGVITANPPGGTESEASSSLDELTADIVRRINQTRLDDFRGLVQNKVETHDRFKQLRAIIEQEEDRAESSEDD